MKKILLLSTLLLILLIPSINRVSADVYESTLNGESIVLKKTSDDGTVEIKSVPLYVFEDKIYFGIREMSNACNASIEWVDETKYIKVKSNGSEMLFKNNSNEVYINGTTYDFGIPVIIRNGTSYATIDIYKTFTGEGDLNSLVLQSDNSTDEIDGLNTDSEKGNDSDRIMFDFAPDKIKSHFLLSNPSRIVIDLQVSGVEINIPEGNTYSGIRTGNQGGGITRVVFDLLDEYEYQINAHGNSFMLDISKDGIFHESFDLIEVKDSSVEILTSEYSGYTISRQSDPYRVLAFIPDQIITEKIELGGDGDLIISVLAEPVEGGTLITVETPEQCAFELKKLDDRFIVEIYDPVINGLDYHNETEVPYISLAEELASAENEYEIINRGNEIELQIKDSGNILKEGQLYINDEYIKSIYIKRNGNTAAVRIVVKTGLFPAYVRETNTIFYLNETDYSGKLVVISAGHGGLDPGAVVGDIHESDINLSISMKLNIMLLKMGVDTLMIREDDTFYSLDERVNIANENRASLFISIHTNALDDPDFDGLMTLVHSGSLNYNNINGRTAGEIMHKILVEETGAVDRGLRYRNEIVVLRETAMPAVEIEAGFLTNESELSKLLEDAYQDVIAAAAARGIAEVLALID